MEKYQCLNCCKIHTSEEWNKATEEEYGNDNAQLPRDFIEVDGVTTILDMRELVEHPGYMSNTDLPAFACPSCGFLPMANELIRAD